MKNRKILYLLVPMVLLIWGIIILRIVNQVRNRNMISVKLSDSVFKKVEQQQSDTLKLKLDYRDPFLGKNDILKTNIYPQGSVTRTSLISSRDVTVPVSVYYGLVINPKNKKKTGLLMVNQKNYLVREGESVENEKVLKLYQDSVILMKGKLRRTVKKNQNS